MNVLDSMATVLIGIFLLMVAVQGKSGEMVELAKRDKAFLQWAIAAGVLAAMYRQPELKGVASGLIAAAVVGFGIQAGTGFQQRIAALWESIGKSGGTNPADLALKKSH